MNQDIITPPVSYRQDACPPTNTKLQECTLAEYYDILFGGCPDAEKIYNCFIGRLEAYLYRRLNNMSTDAGHDFAIDLSAWYLVECYQKQQLDFNVALDEVEGIFLRAHSHYGLTPTRRIFSSMANYPDGNISSPCQTAVRRALFSYLSQP